MNSLTINDLLLKFEACGGEEEDDDGKLKRKERKKLL